MPSKSQAEHRLMEAVAHNPAVAQRRGIPQSVGREYASADRGVKIAGLPQRRHTEAHAQIKAARK